MNTAANHMPNSLPFSSPVYRHILSFNSSLQQAWDKYKCFGICWSTSTSTWHYFWEVLRKNPIKFKYKYTIINKAFTITLCVLVAPNLYKSPTSIKAKLKFFSGDANDSQTIVSWWLRWLALQYLLAGCWANYTVSVSVYKYIYPPAYGLQTLSKGNI